MLLKTVSLLIAIIAIGCGSNASGVDGPDATTSITEDGGASPGDSMTGTADANANWCELSPSQLLSNQDHCGMCGRSCLGRECVTGTCKASLVTKAPPETIEIGPINVSDLFVVYTLITSSDWSIHRILANGDSPTIRTRRTSPGVPQELVINNGTIYFPSSSMIGAVPVGDVGDPSAKPILNDDPVTGAITKSGDKMYWTTSNMKLKNSVMGSGISNTSHFGPSIAGPIKVHENDIYLWVDRRLFKTPVTSQDPFNPVMSPLTTWQADAAPADFEVTSTAVFWHDRSTNQLMRTGKNNPDDTVVLLDNVTGGVAIHDSIIYIGTGPTIQAVDMDGNHIADISVMSHYTTDCTFTETPRRMKISNGHLHFSTEDVTDCNVSSSWRIYRVPTL